MKNFIFFLDIKLLLLIQVNRTYVALVAVDINDKPTKVPGLILESEEEKAEWKAGKKRKDFRILRRKKSF